MSTNPKVELPPFAEAWAKKEAEGFRYNGDALENVEFGYAIAQDELASLSTHKAAPVSDGVARACPECDPPGSGQECRGGPCGHCGGTGLAPFNLGARAREMLAGELGGVQARQALRTTGHFTVDAHAALRAIERALSGLDEAREALEPFARLLKRDDPRTPDVAMVVAQYGMRTLYGLCVGDLRRARTTLDKLRSAS